MTLFFLFFVYQQSRGLIKQLQHERLCGQSIKVSVKHARRRGLWAKP